MADTPYAKVMANFTMPFEAYPLQQDAVNDFADRQNTGLYMDVGTGKTSVSVLLALYKLLTSQQDQAIVLMPPILLQGWYRYLSRIPEIKALIYAGTPAKRAALPLGKHEFTLMSYEIFKRDEDRIYNDFRKSRLIGIADEATALKNVGSGNHQFFADVFGGNDDAKMLLTGTPLSTPLDAYAYIKLIAPGVYRNQNQFMNVHVAAYDDYDRPVEWKELDILAENMGLNSVRILKEDMLKDMPDVTFDQIPYSLSSAHYKLYKRMAEEQLLLMPDGGKIDLNQAQKLFHALQQVVLNPDYFSGDEGMAAAGLELTEQILEELGDKKLVVSAIYQMTNRMLLRKLTKHQPAAIYGGHTATKNEAELQRFLTDPACRVMIIQPKSGGYGIDGLQHVCQDMLFLEAPTIPAWVTQTVARLHRNGQKFNVHARFAIAEGTAQVRMFRNLLSNDARVNQIVRGPRDLRDAIFGG